ncbi:hypothetical protein [Xylophilus rhododendri]|nr:hypothetical protein [Xylophilus rhododendri]
MNDSSTDFPLSSHSRVAPVPTSVFRMQGVLPVSEPVAEPDAASRFRSLLCVCRAASSDEDFRGVPTRSLDITSYLRSHTLLAEWLAALVAGPAFGVALQDGAGRCEVRLCHPRARDAWWKQHVRRIDGRYVKCDEVLNGFGTPGFRPFLVLKLRMVQTALALMGLGPVSDIAIWRAPAGRRWAIVASRRAPGRELEIRADRAAYDRFIGAPAGAAVLSAAWLLELNDVIKPDRQRVLNLVQSDTGALAIIDGLDLSPPQLTRAMLPADGIRRLFGLGRQELLQALAVAADAAHDFAARHGPVLTVVDAALQGQREATEPLAMLDEYIARCHARLDGLRD